jgi:HEAT repeat protein
MGLIILLAVAGGGVIWWLNSKRAVGLNEKIYLKSRGYDPGPVAKEDAGVRQEARLMDLLDSLDDVTPYSRERAAEELSLMCESGGRDERMLAPLVTALDDRNASVRGAAALALGNLGDPRAIHHLRRLVEGDESPHAKNQAERALLKLEAQPVLEADPSEHPLR